MIALLPVSRYRVQYHVASGRPYSFFERFILEAVGEGRTSLEELEQTFRVHRRVLIEGVVTLIQAGWVAIDRNTHHLVSTETGKRAIAQADQLPKNIAVVEQIDYVVGERVQGQLAKGTEVTFSPRSALRAHMDQAVVIPTGDLQHTLDPGILVPLLRTSESEWIRSFGPIDIVRDGADFVVVDVDTSSGGITGIPSKWLPLLQDDLLERARSKERQLVQDGAIYSTDPALAKLVRRDFAAVDAADEKNPDEWLLEPALDRVIVGRAHYGLLENWLETARSYVGIVSGRLDGSTISRLEKGLRTAIERGVIVDVIWDSQMEEQRAETHAKGFDLLKKIEWDSRHTSGRGRLAVGRKPSGSNARILFGDVSDTFETVVGSYEWLSSDPEQNRLDMSLLFRERGPLARVARLVADLAAADERLSTGIGLTRLRYAAADLDRQTAEFAEVREAELEKGPPLESVTEVAPPATPLRGALRARIVVGRQHLAILPILADGVSRRFVIAGHRWGKYSEIAFKALMKALEKGCGRVEVRYSLDSDPGGNHDEIGARFQKLGGVIRHIPDSYARIAVADDDTAAVTSFDWLCPDIDRRVSVLSDIGFILRGSGVGLAILDGLGIRRFEVPVPLDAEYITSFRIDRIRSVNRVEWRIGEDAGPGWHVLVGDNGSGKTSILRGLALALIGVKDAQGLRQDWGTWLRGSETTAEVELCLHRTSGTAASGQRLASRSVKLIWERTSQSTTLVASPEEASGILSAGYGPFRRFSGGDLEYEKQFTVVPGLARHISLFDDRVGLTESLAWLRDLQFKKLENDQEASLLLDRVTKLVNECKLFPSGVRLAEITSDKVQFCDDSGHKYAIEELSDGYRSLLSLTFDIVRQLAVRFGAARVFDHDQPYLVSAPAIVLIDEVDAHLHPAWQRTVGQWFRYHFPRIQFIVTTHSPLVCQAAESGSVYRLPDPTDESDVGGMLDGPARARLVYGNVLEAYESGAFGENITRSETSKDFLHRLAELNRKETTSELSQEERREQEKLRAALPLVAHRVDREDSAP